jgi:site-specific recombinase XerD
MIEDMRIRNMSIHTQKAYIRYVSKFAQHHGRSPVDLDIEDIRKYQIYLVNECKISYGTLSQVVGALRFLYRHTLRRPWIIEMLPYPKKNRYLPRVLSREQICKLLKCIRNLKHEAILTCCYAAGLRVAEVAHLRVTDIDSKRMVIRVYQGKRKKDRYVPLSENLLELLREYWRVYRPVYWLFPTRQNPKRPLTTRSIARTCVKARIAAGLPNDVTCHTLRHSFATHLLEDGVNVRAIQILLGHASLKSTALYTHVSTKGVLETKSPFDSMPAQP